MTGDSRNPFQLVAGSPALDFVNTLDDRFAETGPKELLLNYRDLLHFLEQSGLTSHSETRHLSMVSDRLGHRLLERAHNLREALATLLYAWVDENTAPAETLASIEDEIKQARLHQHARWQEGRLQWEWDRRSPELPIWLLSAEAAELLASDAGHVSACDSPTCRWLFQDTSKNHSRRWCDMKICGNRMKARRFKAQHG